MEVPSKRLPACSDTKDKNKTQGLEITKLSRSFAKARSESKLMLEQGAAVERFLKTDREKLHKR